MPGQGSGERYASTQDLARDLTFARERLAEISSTSSAAFAARTRHHPALRSADGGGGAGGLRAVYVLGRRAGERPFPDFQRLTFRRGTVSSARFAPDGRTVVYGAAWDGRPIPSFLDRTDGRESTRLELADADVVSVSSTGEIAMLLARDRSPRFHTGLARCRAPLAGGAPREFTRGCGLRGLVSGRQEPRHRSAGREDASSRVSDRQSPLRTKEWIRPFDCPRQGSHCLPRPGSDALGRDGGPRRAAQRSLAQWKRGAGLAWSADGSEVWFGATSAGGDASSTPSRRRVNNASSMRLPDLDPSPGRFSRRTDSGIANTFHTSTRGMAPGDTEDGTFRGPRGPGQGHDPDGKMLLFYEGNEAISTRCTSVRWTVRRPSESAKGGRWRSLRMGDG